MDAFATPEQMAARSQGAITSASHPYLAQALAAASGVIRGYCGWHVAPVEEETRRFPGIPRERLWLPTGRLVEVLTATDAGTSVDVAALDWDESGLLGKTDWTSGLRNVEITYRHGFDSVPPEITDLTLQIAARALGSPLGVVTEKSLTSSVTWAQTAQGVAGGVVLMEHEKPTLAPYRLGWLP